MHRNHRDPLTILALVCFVLFVLAWIGGTIAFLTYATVVREGAGALILAALVFCGGYGFAQEARRAL